MEPNYENPGKLLLRIIIIICACALWLPIIDIFGGTRRTDLFHIVENFGIRGHELFIEAAFALQPLGCIISFYYIAKYSKLKVNIFILIYAIVSGLIFIIFLFIFMAFAGMDFSGFGK